MGVLRNFVKAHVSDLTGGEQVIDTPISNTEKGALGRPFIVLQSLAADLLIRLKAQGNKARLTRTAHQQQK